MGHLPQLYTDVKPLTLNLLAKKTPIPSGTQKFLWRTRDEAEINQEKMWMETVQDISCNGGCTNARDHIMSHTMHIAN